MFRLCLIEVKRYVNRGIALIETERQVVGIQGDGPRFTVRYKAKGETMATYPSGSMLIICFPMIRDVLCIMSAGRTLFSDMDISLSNTVFITTKSQPSMGSYYSVSLRSPKKDLLQAYRYPEHEHPIHHHMEEACYDRSCIRPFQPRDSQ